MNALMHMQINVQLMVQMDAMKSVWMNSLVAWLVNIEGLAVQLNYPMFVLMYYQLFVHTDDYMDLWVIDQSDEQLSVYMNETVKDSQTADQIHLWMSVWKTLQVADLGAVQCQNSDQQEVHSLQ